MILRTARIILYYPLLTHHCNRTVDIVFEIVVNCSIIIAIRSGKPDQVLMVGMEDNLCGISVTGDDCRVLRYVLSSI